MANVVKEKRGATKAKLTASATDLFYSKGVSNTSLADISEASGIPLGNVYYHFKTKDALAEAVIQARITELKANLEKAVCEQDPLASLKALFRNDTEMQALITEHGCPYISLIQDLDKLNGDLSKAAAELLELYLHYAQDQFEALGLSQTRNLALNFMSRLQGAYLIARSLHSKEVLQSQLDQLELWLDGLQA